MSLPFVRFLNAGKLEESPQGGLEVATGRQQEGSRAEVPIDVTGPRLHPHGKESLALFGRPLYNHTSVQAAALARECQAVPKREEPANSYSWQPGKGKCALNPQ